MERLSSIIFCTAPMATVTNLPDAWGKKVLSRQFGAGSDFHPFRPLLLDNFVAIKITVWLLNRHYNVFPVKHIKCSYFHTSSGPVTVPPHKKSINNVCTSGIAAPKLKIWMLLASVSFNTLFFFIVSFSSARICTLFL